MKLETKWAPLTWWCLVAMSIHILQQLNIPKTLGQVGVTQEHLDALTEAAFKDGCHQQNPRDCSKEDLRQLFVDAL